MEQAAMSPHRSAFTKGLILLAITLTGLALGSCVRSKVRVTSEPPGAEVTMNGINLGQTPVEQPFNWFWYYDFVAAKDGYESTGVRKRFRSPVWLWPPLDLFMEAMPFPVPSVKKVHLKLNKLDERPVPSYSFTET